MDQQFEEFMQQEAANPPFAAYHHQSVEHEDFAGRSIHADEQTVVSEVTMCFGTSIFRDSLYQTPVALDVPDENVVNLFNGKPATDNKHVGEDLDADVSTSSNVSVSSAVSEVAAFAQKQILDIILKPEPPKALAEKSRQHQVTTTTSDRCVSSVSASPNKLQKGAPAAAEEFSSSIVVGCDDSEVSSLTEDEEDTEIVTPGVCCEEAALGLQSVVLQRPSQPGAYASEPTMPRMDDDDLGAQIESSRSSTSLLACATPLVASLVQEDDNGAELDGLRRQMAEMSMELQAFKKQGVVLAEPVVVKASNKKMPVEVTSPKTGIASTMGSFLTKSVTKRLKKKIIQTLTRKQTKEDYMHEYHEKEPFNNNHDHTIPAIHRAVAKGKPVTSSMDDEFMAHFIFHEEDHDDIPRVLVCPKNQMKQLSGGFPLR